MCKDGQLLQENTYNGLGQRVGMKVGLQEETLSAPADDPFTEERKFFQKDLLTDHTDPFGRVIMEQGEKRRHYLWHDNTLLGMPEEESYVLTDLLHTPVRVTDREGKSRSCYAYDEFGVPMYEREEIPLPFGFTGTPGKRSPACTTQEPGNMTAEVDGS